MIRARVTPLRPVRVGWSWGALGSSLARRTQGPGCPGDLQTWACGAQGDGPPSQALRCRAPGSREAGEAGEAGGGCGDRQAHHRPKVAALGRRLGLVRPDFLEKWSLGWRGECGAGRAWDRSEGVHGLFEVCGGHRRGGVVEEGGAGGLWEGNCWMEVNWMEGSSEQESPPIRDLRASKKPVQQPQEGPGVAGSG